MPHEPVQAQPPWVAAEHDVAKSRLVKGRPSQVDGIARRQLGSHAAAADAEADVWKGPKNVTKNRLGKALRSLDRVARRLPGARR